MEVEGKDYVEKEDAGKAIIDVCTKMTAPMLSFWGSPGAFLWCWPMMG